MATRSFIAMWDEFSDEYSAIYCHWDGYPLGVGVTLRDYFTRVADVHSLLELGGVSTLKEGFGETATEGNLFNEEKKNFTSFNEMVGYYRGCGCEFGYVYLDGKWLCYDIRPTKVDLYSLEEAAYV